MGELVYRSAMADPFREQRFSARDVRRIVRRAAELAERDPATAGIERTLTREELERGAADLGIPASAVAAATGQANEASDDVLGAAQDRSAFLGAPTRLVYEREFDGEPDDAQREDLVEDIRELMRQTGTVETVGKALTWHFGAGYPGRMRDFSVRVRPRNGRTRILVEERLVRAATSVFVGFGVGGGMGPMAAYIAAVANFGPVWLLAPVVWISLMLLLARTIFMAVASRRARELSKVARRIEENAAAWSRPRAPSRERIAASAGTERAAVSPADDAASEAEDEADDAASAARARRA
jgi:hypothetical protein